MSAEAHLQSKLLQECINVVLITLKLLVGTAALLVLLTGASTGRLADT